MNINSREEILKLIRIGLHRLAVIQGKNENSHRSLLGYEKTQQKLEEKLRKEINEKKSLLVDMFMNEITKVNGKAFILKSEDDIKDCVIRLAEEYSAKSVAIWESDFLRQIHLDEILGKKGLTLFLPNGKDRMAKVDIGITEVDYAIADTGTIVLLANEKQQRSVSLIPPVHIAIVKSDNIVENIKDLFVLLTNTIVRLGSLRNLTNCITFITGPSRTGDIELNITLGVHGPKELLILIYYS
jgi:L-lactate dehydrogenase complex protein LldG